MKTQDLFKSNRSAKRLNESLEKTFGTKINFQDFDTAKLEDSRNKLRTQIHDARSQSGFNETIENETLTKAQWMHDAIVAELAEREEYIVDTTTDENYESMWEGSENMSIGQQMARDGITYSPEKEKELIGLMSQYMKKAGMSPKEIRYYLSYDEDFIPDQLSDLPKEGRDDFDDPDNPKNWGGDHNDQAAWDDRHKEEVEMEAGREMTGTARDRFISTMTPRMDNDALMQKVAKVVNSPEFTEDTILKIVDAGNTVTHPVARYIQKEFEELQYDLGREYEDYPESVAEKLLSMLIARTKQGVAEGDQDWMDDMRAAAHKMAPQDKLKRDQETRQSQQQADQQKKLQQDIENLPELMAQFRKMKSEYESLGGSNYQYADREQNLSAGERRARDMESTLRQLANRISAAKQQSMNTESVTTGEDMARLQEGEIQQASAIVTAKTMVDRVGRWIEELSGMENDTLLQLGDSIRDEMGQEQAKAFISAVAPAIQQALDTLKGTRDILSTGVRSLASGETPTDMLGAEPDAMGGDEMAAEPDAMNMSGEDEFAAAEPAAGGLGDAGREQRESISRSGNLLRALAG